jgi:hypothetical protein
MIPGHPGTPRSCLVRCLRYATVVESRVSLVAAELRQLAAAGTY